MPTAPTHHADAIPKATELFWAKGFHATSMRNLQQAINLRPGSIYASFGSKEGLFREALMHYSQRSRTQLNVAIEQAGDPITGLKQFVIDVLQCQSEAPSNMCMLVKTIAELTEDQADLLAEAKRLLNVMEGEFADAIRQAQAQGLINAEQDPVRMAQRLQIQFMGLRTYIRAHGETERVVELVEDLFEHL